MPRINDWIHEVRTEATRLLLAANALSDLTAEYHAGAYGSGDPAGEKITTALEGTTETVTADEIINIIGSTVTAIDALMAAGHRDNLVKVRTTLPN